MARILLALMVGALACASTTQTIHGRSFNHGVAGDVKEVSPGHWAGTYKSVVVVVEDVRSNEALPCTETGSIDMVWLSPTELKSCTNKATTVCTAPDGSSFTGEQTMTCKLGPNGLLMFEGTGSQVSGDGRFEGRKSTITFTSWSLNKAGDLGYGVNTNKVTMPPKK